MKTSIYNTRNIFLEGEMKKKLVLENLDQITFKPDTTGFPDDYIIHSCGSIGNDFYVRYVFNPSCFSIGEYASMPHCLFSDKGCFYKESIVEQTYPKGKVILVMYTTREPKMEYKPHLQISHRDTIVVRPEYCEEEVETIGSFSGETYLHGNLEDMCGHDCIEFVDVPVKNIKPVVAYDGSYNGRTNKVDWSRNYIKHNLEGLYNVKVIGIDEPCVGLFWYETRKIKYKDVEITDYMQKGRIVLKSEMYLL